MKFDKPEIRNNHKKGRYKLDQIVIDAEDRLKLKYKIVKIFDKGYHLQIWITEDTE